MKISNKFFFLFFFSIFILIPISSFSLFVNAGDVANPIISTDILSVDLGSFQDNTPGDGSGKLDYITGGFDLISFENLGQYGQPNYETGEVIYRAKVKWGLEVNAWTSALFRNIYPNININNVEEQIYLSIQYWRHVNCLLTGLGHYQSSTPTYGIKFYDIDFGSSYKQHDYHGSIPIIVGIDPGLKYSGEITVAGQAFTVPTLTSDILYTKIVDMRGGECGSYVDRYSNQGFSTASVTIKTDPDLFDSGVDKITEDFNEKGIGGITKDSNDTVWVQQSVYDLSYKGSTMHASGVSNEQAFSLPVHIQPEVTKLRNYFNLMKGGFHWYSCCGKYRKAVWSVDERIQRDVSVHVQNIFVHYDLEMESDLFMTCRFSGEISETFLEDPNLVISDMIWDQSIWGDEKVEIELIDEGVDWLIIILVVIIIGVGVYVVYTIYKKRSQEKFFLRLAGRKA